jgi:spore maturation protein CgeB
MRVLIFDHYYPEFVAGVYGADPGLRDASFERQQAALDAGLFGETQFQAEALRSLGHAALHFPVNVAPLGAAWAREQGLRLARRSVPGVRLRRGWVPWPTTRVRDIWLGSLLAGVADRFEADWVHVQCMDVLPESVVRALRAPGRVLTGQTAAPSPPWTGLGAFELVFSSLPNYVARYRTMGVPAAFLPLAFAPAVLDRVGSVERDVALSFVGSLTPKHRHRIEFVSELAVKVPLDIFADGADLPGARRHPGVWGKAMYRVLARSRLTLNVHGEHAAGNANNLRLYEATGMGAILLTEEAPNLTQLFAPGEEVVTYRDMASLLQAIDRLERNPEEARAIAAAGQVRTMRDHTWTVRMGRMLEIVDGLARRERSNAAAR